MFSSSISVRISDLVEFDASEFAFSDKKDDLVEYKFALSTASIMKLIYLLLLFDAPSMINFLFTDLLTCSFSRSLFTVLIVSVVTSILILVVELEKAGHMILQPKLFQKYSAEVFC